MVLPSVSAPDGQDECVACCPVHKFEHHRVLRMGGRVFLEQGRRGADSRWAVLQRPVVCADADELQSADRSVRERGLSTRREGIQESEKSPRCAAAYFVSDSLLRALLSNSFRLHESSAVYSPPDVLAYRLDDGRAVPAGLRSAAPERGETEAVASRIGSVTTVRIGIVADSTGQRFAFFIRTPRSRNRRAPDPSSPRRSGSLLSRGRRGCRWRQGVLRQACP